MDVVVTGIGLASALGNREQTWQRLSAGESGICERQLFEALPAGPMAMVGQLPVDLVDLTETVVEAALADARLTVPLADCAVVVGSSRGGQGRLEHLLAREWTGANGSMELGQRWLQALPNAAAIATAQLLQTEAIVFAPMAACATGIWAIAQGAALIRRGECQRVLAGAVEAPMTPLTLAGFRQMGALATTGCYPFDRQREGLVLGEGGAVLVLEAAALAEQRQAPIYGRVLGAGLTADGYHVSAPDLGGTAAIAAIHQCLQRSGLAAIAVDYIHAHGTGTHLNDQREAAIVQQLFPHGVPISSTKGATGHTLGASGALGAAFCLMALRDQRLPPCVGLQTPEFPLKWVTQSTAMRVDHALCLSFGFGGQNAAIAFGH
jgi:3-oxoacyl-[acyl-carrier-protein] synthase II